MVTGPIGAGKTTVAAAVAERTRALHLSSDALRGAHGHPFTKMRRATEGALAQGRRVILDSTGMSFRFRALVENLRERAYHVHLLVDAPEWHARELRRTDRAPLDESVYRESSAIRFATPPDLTVDTTALPPGEAAAIVTAAWETSAA